MGIFWRRQRRLPRSPPFQQGKLAYSCETMVNGPRPASSHDGAPARPRASSGDPQSRSTSTTSLIDGLTSASSPRHALQHRPRRRSRRPWHRDEAFAIEAGNANTPTRGAHSAVGAHPKKTAFRARAAHARRRRALIIGRTPPLVQEDRNQHLLSMADVRRKIERTRESTMTDRQASRTN